MHIFVRMLCSPLWVLIAACFVTVTSHAHLMVAQSGTLNIKGDGVFMVLSLPVSAFVDIDDNGDRMLSDDEFSLHRSIMMEQVEQAIALIVGESSQTLRGALLSPVFGHDGPKNTASQVVVMGRFVFAETPERLRFTANLFGTGAKERSLKITATRSVIGDRKVVTLTPESPTASLF